MPFFASRKKGICKSGSGGVLLTGLVTGFKNAMHIQGLTHCYWCENIKKREIFEGVFKAHVCA
jgi:hypothetical protein